MAKIYTKSTTLGNENCLILNGREGVTYPLPFKNASRIKIGMFFSVVPATNDNATIVSSTYNETLPNITARDKFYFGLKKSQSTDMPGENGEYFWGSRSHIINAGASRFEDWDWATEYPRRTTQYTNTTYTFTADGSPTSSFASYLGIEFIIGPDALAADGVKSVQMADRRTGPFTNVSGSNLRTESLNNTFSSLNGGFFSQVNAADNPAALFVHWPFFNTRLRIHSIGAYQVA